MDLGRLGRRRKLRQTIKTAGKYPKWGGAIHLIDHFPNSKEERGVKKYVTFSRINTDDLSNSEYWLIKMQNENIKTWFVDPTFSILGVYVQNVQILSTISCHIIGKVQVNLHEG